MKIEDRLHDAMHDYADGVEPEPGSWAWITARVDAAPAPRRPSRRPLVLAGAALALVVVLITVLAIRDGGGDTRVTTKPSAPSTASTNRPNGVVAALASSRLVELRSDDGRESRSLGTFTNLGSLSTTPDGRDVFFQSRGPSGACAGNPGPNVNRLDPVTGTTTEFMGGSVSPVVSPDGKLVAYGTWCDHRTLGFTNLVSGGNARTDPLGGTTSDANPKVETVEPLGWSPDSTLLLYRLGLKGDQDPHYYVGRFRSALHQGETAVTALPYGRGITAAAFVDNETVALAESTTSGRTEVRRWTVDTGSQELPSPVMFEVPARVHSLVADASGQHFLAVTDGGGLYRWSRGDARPTKVADGVSAAAWLPDATSRFGADAHLPSDFPSEVPKPAQGTLRSIVAETNPPDASYTVTYRLDDLDAIEAGNQYRTRLQRAGFEIQNHSSGGDGQTVQFDGIGKRWDVTVVAGRSDPRDPASLWVQVRTHGLAVHDMPGTGSTSPGVTAPAG